jgi:predicted chitinase
MAMNRAAFFDNLRDGLLGPSLDTGEVGGCEAILDAMAGEPLSWCAYALSTAYHETAHTMQPIKEYGGARYFFRMYDPQGQRPQVARRLGNTEAGDGVKFAGRGYVQLTGRANYAKAGAKLGLDLIAQPDLAMRPDVAADIMREGMLHGWFTGRGFYSYLPSVGGSDRKAYINARRIINGIDRAGDIADYAGKFEAALRKGEWA